MYFTDKLLNSFKFLRIFQACFVVTEFYQRVAAFRRKGVKVSMALGGWNDSQGDKYSRLVNSPAARKRFIEHVLTFLKKYGFDGLDLDWEYPKCWQVMWLNV